MVSDQGTQWAVSASTCTPMCCIPLWSGSPALGSLDGQKSMAGGSPKKSLLSCGPLVVELPAS